MDKIFKSELGYITSIGIEIRCFARMGGSSDVMFGEAILKSGFSSYAEARKFMNNFVKKHYEIVEI
jgi:hypothetical protein